MKIPWQRMKNRPGWFWGAVGAVCMAAVLLVWSLMPRSEPMAGYDDESAVFIPSMPTFTLSAAEQIVAVPVEATVPQEEFAVEHITVVKDQTPESYLAYKSLATLTIQNYTMVDPPLTEEAARISRILYQSMPYLTQDEIISMLTQNGFVGAEKLTKDEIIVATQLAIMSVLNNTGYDFTDVDKDFPLAKPLYMHYKGITAVPASPFAFSIDTKQAMWIGGKLYGPMRIQPSVGGYAHGVKFDLSGGTATSFVDASGNAITSITVSEPFYLQLDSAHELPEGVQAVSFQAISQLAVSHEGEALFLSPNQQAPQNALSGGEAYTSSSLYEFNTPGMIFTAKSVYDKAIVTADVLMLDSIEK